MSRVTAVPSVIKVEEEYFWSLADKVNNAPSLLAFNFFNINFRE